MSRWLLALLFAFGSVTFLTGCPAEEEAETPDAEDVEDAAAGAIDEAAGAIDDATPAE